MDEKLNHAIIGEHIGDQTTYTKDADGNIKYSNSLAITDHIPEYIWIRQKIIEFGKEFDTKNQKDPIQFQSKDEMIRQVKMFFSRINTALGERIDQVIRNYDIHKDIVLVKEGPCTGKITPEGNGIRTELRITPDARGLVCLAQELSNAYIFDKYEKQKAEEERIDRENLKKNASKFFGLLITGYIAEELPIKLSPEQLAAIQLDVIQDMSPNIFQNPEDEALLDKILEDNPHAFDHCENNEDFINAYNQIAENPNTRIPDNRDIMEKSEHILKNPTKYINTADGLSALTALTAYIDYEKSGHNPEIASKVVKGLYTAESMMAQGKTPEQIAQETEASLDSAKEMTRNPEMQNEEEYIRVLEMNKLKNSTN